MLDKRKYLMLHFNLAKQADAQKKGINNNF